MMKKKRKTTTMRKMMMRKKVRGQRRHENRIGEGRHVHYCKETVCLVSLEFQQSKPLLEMKWIQKRHKAKRKRIGEMKDWIVKKIRWRGRQWKGVYDGRASVSWWNDKFVEKGVCVHVPARVSKWVKRWSIDDKSDGNEGMIKRCGKVLNRSMRDSGNEVKRWYD